MESRYVLLMRSFGMVEFRRRPGYTMFIQLARPASRYILIGCRRRIALRWGMTYRSPETAFARALDRRPSPAVYPFYLDLYTIS